MMLAAIFSVATMAALFLGLGIAIGQARGKRLARIEALNTCIDLAGMIQHCGGAR